MTEPALLGIDNTVGGPTGSPLSSSPPKTMLVESITTLANAANSTLEAGHEWKLNSGKKGAAGTNLNYTGDQGLASQCIKLESVAESSEAVKCELTRMSALNLKGRHLRFLFKVDPSSTGKVKAIRVRCGSGSTAFESQFKMQMVSLTAEERIQLEAFAKPGEWVAWTLQPCGTTREGVPNWEAIQDLSIEIEGLGIGSVILYFGGVEIVENDSRFPRGVLSFTFDDNFLKQYTFAAPLLAKYGFKGTAYITGSKLREPEEGHGMSLAQMEHLIHVQGWDAGVHCDLAEHNVTGSGMTGFSNEVIAEDFALLQQYLVEHGLPGGNHLAIPSGCFTTSMMEVVRRMMSSARTTASYGSESIPPAMPHRLRTIEVLPSTTIGPDTTVGSVKWVIKEAYEQGGWVILTHHDFTSGAAEGITIKESVFKEIVEYVASKGIPVRKIGEVLGV